MAEELVDFESVFKVSQYQFLTLGLNPYFEAKYPSSPNRRQFNKAWFFTFICVITICALSNTLYMLSKTDDLNTKNLLEICECLSCTLGGIMALEQLSMVWRKGDRFNEFILQLERMFPSEGNAQKRYSIATNNANTLSLLNRIANLYMIMIFIWTAGTLIIDAAYLKYQELPYELEPPLKMWAPFDLRNPILLPIIILLQLMTIYGCVVGVLCVNVFLTAIMSHICLQFNILAQMIEELRPNDTQGLLKLISMHLRLISISHEFAELISRPVFIFNTVSSLCLCSAMMELILGNVVERIKYAFYLLIVLMQNYNMSNIGDQLISSVSNFLGQKALSM